MSLLESVARQCVYDKLAGGLSYLTQPTKRYIMPEVHFLSSYAICTDLNNK